MSELITRLDEQRGRALTAAREIADRAAAGQEKAEDEEAYKRANAEIDRLGGLIRDEVKRSADDAEFAQAIEAAKRSAGTREVGGQKADDVDPWLADLRGALKGETRTKGTGKSRVEARDMAFHPEMRVDTILDLTKGAETLAPSLSRSLFHKLFSDSTVLGMGVTVLRTADGNALKFPRLTALGATTQANAKVAEKGTINKAEMAFDSVSLGAYKYGNIQQSDRELIQDSVFDIQGLMGTCLGRNMANYLGYDLLLGTGTDEPKGIMAQIGTNVATGNGAKAGVIENSDQLLDVIWLLPVPYRRNGKFLMNDKTVLTFRKMKINGEAENYAYKAGLGGAPDTLMGYPLMVDPYVAEQAVDTVSIAFFDPSLYYVRMVADLRVEWSTEYAWDTDLVSVKGVLRADGDSIDVSAFAGFKGGALA